MPVVLFLLGGGKSVLGLLRGLPWQVYAAIGAIIAALVLWHAVAVHERKVWNEGYNVAWTAGQRREAVQRRSIDTLQAALAAKNAESVARAQAFDASKTEDARNIAKADAALRADASRMQTLEAIRVEALKHPGCPVPSVLSQQLDGL